MGVTDFINFDKVPLRVERRGISVCSNLLWGPRAPNLDNDLVADPPVSMILLVVVLNRRHSQRRFYGAKHHNVDGRSTSPPLTERAVRSRSQSQPLRPEQSTVLPPEGTLPASQL